jgi:hypothetical protein
VANDHMALDVLRALHDCGRFVPDDVSVVGFDDVLESSSFQPPLTTVHQDFRRGRPPLHHTGAGPDTRRDAPTGNRLGSDPFGAPPEHCCPEALVRL